MMQNSNFKNPTPLIILIIFLSVVIIYFLLSHKTNRSPNYTNATVAKVADKNIKPDTFAWKAPDEATISKDEAGDEIRYGKELIAHTAIYFGPKGKVAKISNGMNCQNCHNYAGTKPYGFDFSKVATTFPQFSKRSQSWLSIAGRINSCFHRSLNGQSPDTTGKEIKAMIAYIKWVGKNVPKGVQPVNTGVLDVNYLDRAADRRKGRIIYATCQVCHGTYGQGQLNEQGNEYIFPPLWGPHSYNDGAGLYQLGLFAAFVKANMPFGTTYKHPFLTDEQAWDVAAFVNSQPRPHKDQSKDFSVISNKPVDFPFGPYADRFTEKQHKYGPYQPILAEKKKSALGNK